MRRLAIGLVMFSAVFSDAQAQTIQSLTPAPSASIGLPAIDDNGNTVVGTVSMDPLTTNPTYAMQLFSWSFPGGSVSQKTSLARGLARPVSISDDGTKIAFISPSDPLGTNADGSLEALLWDETSQSLTQLTADSSPGAGSVTDIAISGGGTRIVIASTTDPLGTNPLHLTNLFGLDSDGSNMDQLTPNETVVRYSDISLSDSGLIVVYRRAPTNSIADLSIFVGSSRSMARTELASGGVFHPQISGNAATIVFERSLSVESVPRTGGATTILAAGRSPTITDDAQWVVFSRGGELWEISTSTLIETQLTSIPLMGPTESQVTGNHTHVLYERNGNDGSGVNPDAGPEFALFDYATGNVVQLTQTPGLRNDTEPHASGDGNWIVYSTNVDVATGLVDRGQRVVALDRAQGAYSEVASLGWSPSIDAAGSVVAFVSRFDPFGLNPGGTDQLFTAAPDGSALSQRTQASGPLLQPQVSHDGSFVVFASYDDFVGQNVDGSLELFRINLSDSTILQLTQLDDNWLPNLRLSADDDWVVFQSATDVDGMNASGLGQVFRVATDGSGATRITSSQTSSWSPTVSADGNLIVFSSGADFLGTNADGTRELFLWNHSDAVMTQLTATSISTLGMKPVITPDGEYVYFYSRAPYFEDRVGHPKELYRMLVATQTIERAGGLYDPLAPFGSSDFGESNPLQVVDTAGRLYVAASGDLDRSNVDRDTELWVIDFDALNRIEPSKATPTSLVWQATPQAASYDVIRTQRSALVDLGGSVDLGAVVCLIDDTQQPNSGTVTDTVGPAVGEVFLYLVRSNSGSLVPSVGWGSGDAGPRSAGAGDCPG